jgi:hypothetical protein
MRLLIVILVCCASVVARAQSATTQPAPLIGQQLLNREASGAGYVPLYICARGAKPTGDDIEVAGPCVIRSDERGFMLVAELGLKIHIRDQQTITVDGQCTSSAGATGEVLPPLIRTTHASFFFDRVIPRLLTPADIVNVKQEVDETMMASSDPQALMNYLQRETLHGNFLPMVRYMSSGEDFQSTPGEQTRARFIQQLRLTPDQAQDLTTDDLFVRVLRNTFWFEWTKVLRVKVTKEGDDKAKADRVRLDGTSSSEMHKSNGRWVPG